MHPCPNEVTLCDSQDIIKEFNDLLWAVDPSGQRGVLQIDLLLSELCVSLRVCVLPAHIPPIPQVQMRSTQWGRGGTSR